MSDLRAICDFPAVGLGGGRGCVLSATAARCRVGCRSGWKGIRIRRAFVTSHSLLSPVRLGCVLFLAPQAREEPRLLGSLNLIGSGESWEGFFQSSQVSCDVAGV